MGFMFYQLGPTSIKAQTLDFVHLHSLRVEALVAQGHIHLDRRVKAPLAQSTTLAAAHWDGYEEHSVCVCVWSCFHFMPQGLRIFSKVDVEPLRITCHISSHPDIEIPREWTGDGMSWHFQCLCTLINSHESGQEVFIFYTCPLTPL